MRYSETKYDEYHEPIMTTLFYIHGINDTRVLLSVPGWKNHDQMMELYKEINDDKI